MTSTIPNILIGLGALIVAVGAYISQFGWNKASEINQRIEMVRILAETNHANYQTISRAELAGQYQQQRADPVEFDILAAALSSGLFADKDYEEVRLQLRSTKVALQAYNYAASFTYQTGAWASGPRDLTDAVARSLTETRSLAKMLEKPPYNQVSVPVENDSETVGP